jgi:hypothetical protein
MFFLNSFVASHVSQPYKSTSVFVYLIIRVDCQTIRSLAKAPRAFWSLLLTCGVAPPFSDTVLPKQQKSVTHFISLFCIAIGSVPGSTRDLPSPHRPDRLRGPPSLLSIEYRGIFPRA